MTQTTRFLFVALLAALIPTVTAPPALAAGETPAPDPHLAAMEALPDLVGTWEGEGWMRRGPGEPTTFTSTEIVESRLGGRVWVVEGIHTATESGERLHHALATISYDVEAGVYDFRSFVIGRGGGNFTGRLEDGAFVWGMETPDGGKIRYTVRVKGDVWNETGAFSRDGDTWNDFFGMELRRTGD